MQISPSQLACDDLVSGQNTPQGGCLIIPGSQLRQASWRGLCMHAMQQCYKRTCIGGGGAH